MNASAPARDASASARNASASAPAASAYAVGTAASGSARAHASTGHQALFPTYARAEPVFTHGEGAWLVERGGERWLDFSTGIAVNALGHAHPHLVATLKEAAERVWHLSNLYEIPDQTRLAERLCAATFADRVFFTNSGAEALECAIKAARRYHYNAGAPERVDVITFEGAFHGRTLATIAAGGQEKYLEGFGEKAPGFVQLPFGDHEALKAAIGPTTAAILIEPVQGEGGVRGVPPQCLRGLRALCDERGILLIYDEVQTGIGRSGRLFAHEWANDAGNASPDLMAIAKGLGGGFPVGACLATEEVGTALTLGTHGTTFGGNPLAMAVANAVLDVVLEDGFLDHVSEAARDLRQGLASLVDRFPDVFEDGPRGEGLLIGLKCAVPNSSFVAAAREERLLLVPAGDNVVRLLPPLVATDGDMREGLARLEAAAERVRAAAPS